MGLFSREQKNMALEEGLQKAHDAIAELHRQLDTQQSAFRNLETEWLNTHEKFKAIMGRLQKRYAAGDETPPEPPGGNNEDSAAGPFDHLDPVSKKIMERRTRR